DPICPAIAQRRSPSSCSRKILRNRCRQTPGSRNSASSTDPILFWRKFRIEERADSKGDQNCGRSAECSERRTPRFHELAWFVEKPEALQSEQESLNAFPRSPQRANREL